MDSQNSSKRADCPKVSLAKQESILSTFPNRRPNEHIFFLLKVKTCGWEKEPSDKLFSNKKTRRIRCEVIFRRGLIIEKYHL